MGSKMARGSSWYFILSCSRLAGKSVSVSVFPANVVRFDVIVRFRYIVHLSIVRLLIGLARSLVLPPTSPDLESVSLGPHYFLNRNWGHGCPLCI